MQAKLNVPRSSVYEIVTSQIIKQLEAGVAPWRKPWRLFQRHRAHDFWHDCFCAPTALA